MGRKGKTAACLGPCSQNYHLSRLGSPRPIHSFSLALSKNRPTARTSNTKIGPALEDRMAFFQLIFRTHRPTCRIWRDSASAHQSRAHPRPLRPIRREHVSGGWPRTREETRSVSEGIRAPSLTRRVNAQSIRSCQRTRIPGRPHVARVAESSIEVGHAFRYTVHRFIYVAISCSSQLLACEEVLPHLTDVRPRYCRAPLLEFCRHLLEIRCHLIRPKMRKTV
jgi:hypothetical protein